MNIITDNSNSYINIIFILNFNIDGDTVVAFYGTKSITSVHFFYKCMKILSR